MRRKPKQMPHWETRRIALPVPVWAELERRHGNNIRGRERNGMLWASDTFRCALINWFYLPRTAHWHYLQFDQPDAFLAPRWEAMKEEWEVSADLDKAKAATLKDPIELPQPGRISSVGRADALSLLAGSLRGMHADDCRRWATWCLSQIPTTGERPVVCPTAITTSGNALTLTAEGIGTEHRPARSGDDIDRCYSLLRAIPNGESIAREVIACVVTDENPLGRVKKNGAA